MTFEERLLITLETHNENQARLARALNLSRQMFRYKLMNDKFTRTELNQMKIYLRLTNEEFLELILDE